ncbi:MAG: type II toxin-antitoxin system RelE/ParE family toxin [Robiginitomaculum sp.]|nr:type II toxin-antitoxin system RelE/ParE family toxin [Robiginitomaculum sp.]
MASYRLSLEAENDIDDILTYGVIKYGLETAVLYHDELTNHFAYIAQYPLQFMKVDHISLGSRRSIFHTHTIYFNINGEIVFIERIIGRQNLTQ